MVIFHFGRLPFCSSSILVVFILEGDYLKLCKEKLGTAGFQAKSLHVRVGGSVQLLLQLPTGTELGKNETACLLEMVFQLFCYFKCKITTCWTININIGLNSYNRMDIFIKFLLHTAVIGGLFLLLNLKI